MIQACEALADPIRAEIVERLARGDLTAGEIAGGFAVSRPAVSRHLRVLRECGLVTCEAEAQRRVYRLNRQPLQDLGAWIRQLDALGDHLDEMARQRKTKR
jgi:DNA-binding transcriptional ArsR family regulator